MLFGALTFGLVAAFNSNTRAANFVVTTTASTGAGSLQEALELSQQNAVADNIRFAVSGTITLPNLPANPLGGGITIDGIGEDVIISGGHVRRHFLFTGNATVRNLTLEDGYVDFGGSIRSVAHLSVINVLFRNNVASNSPLGPSPGGAIASTGIITAQLNVLNCRFIGNRAGSFGGAIYAEGRVRISRSYFAENHAKYGGAMSASGEMNISYSEFANNVAGSFGGAIITGTLNADPPELIVGSSFHNNASNIGGALSIHGPKTIEIVNSTFSGNTAQNYGGGIAAEEATLIITNTTIVRNFAAQSGSGIRNTNSKIELRNTIVGMNLGQFGLLGDCSTDLPGITVANDHNYDTDGSCASATQSTAAGLNLGPLANNGGLTPNHALLPGSVAIDAGNNSQAFTLSGAPLPVDQRGPGFPRVFNVTVDVGAFELQGP
jgi:predicted outer membrane repeat protein